MDIPSRGHGSRSGIGLAHFANIHEKNRQANSGKQKMTFRCVVPVSGGKDSQACLEIALELFPKAEILGLFCDTQFEHPKTYSHIEKMRGMYGVEIRKISAGSVDEKVLKYGRFPGGGARHCTDELKIAPSKKFYKALAEEQGGFQVFYGMRWGESPEREKRYLGAASVELYAPHEVMPSKYPKYLAKLGVMFRLPIIEWTKEQVFSFLGGRHNELYDEGHDRVGCFPCLAGGDESKEKAFTHDEFGRSQRIRVKNLEDVIGKDIFTSKGGCQRNNPLQGRMFESSGCAVCEI